MGNTIKLTTADGHSLSAYRAGSLVWLAATRLGPHAAVGYYGGQIIGFVSEKPKCPTMLHFGENDTGIPMDDVHQIRDTHDDITVHVYPAGHGFNCDHRGSFDPSSAATARERTLEFFEQHL